MRYAALLGSLGRSFRSRARIFAATLYLVARHRVGRPPGRWIALEFATGDGSFSAVVDDISDLHAVDEILLRRQYDHRLEEDPRTIVDLGSHIGISVGYFRLRYPDARIFAFEPNPVSFNKLRWVVSRMDGVVIRQAALSSSSGRATLHTTDRPLRASLEGSRESGRSDEVQTVTLDHAVREHELDRVDLLKIDIEGAELDVLSSFTHLDRVRTIVGELHPSVLGDRTQNVFGLLREYEVETWPAGDDLIFLARRS